VDIFFEEQRDLAGRVYVTLHLAGARVMPKEIPPRYKRIFDTSVTSDMIGFYVFDLNHDPRPKRCIKIRAAWVVASYQYDYVIQSLFWDAIDRVNSLHNEGMAECVAISLTDTSKSAEDVLHLWQRFKVLEGSNPGLKFSQSRVHTDEEIQKIKEKDDEFGFLSSGYKWNNRNRFDYVQVRSRHTILGLPLDSFGETLTPVSEEYNEAPIETVPDLLDRIFEKYPAQQEYYEGYATAKDYLDQLPVRYYDVFDFEEQTKIFFSIYAYSPLAKFFEGDSRGRDRLPNPEPAYELAERLKSSLYQYGEVGKDKDWNTFVDAYNQIPEFDFGLGTQTAIDWPKYHNMLGWAKYSHVYRSGGKWKPYSGRNYDRIYSDCKLVYIVSKKGKPLIYIGFSIADHHRILVCQIQLAKKRGNRWLYKLGMPYFDYALMKMQETFPQFDLYLVQGESLANRIRSNYADDEPLAPEKYQHIIRTYERPLERFDKDPDRLYMGRYYGQQLRPKDLD